MVDVNNRKDTKNKKEINNEVREYLEYLLDDIKKLVKLYERKQDVNNGN